MRTKHIAVFMGTRPEAIKLAPVVSLLRQNGSIRCSVVATGQHREMFRQVVEVLGVHVDEDLDVMTPNQSLAGLSARLIERIDRWLESSTPDMAVVQGDTTTVLTAALASFYRKIPVAHVEAGLRTGDRWSPFPEEINRRLAAQLVSVHFAPTTAAADALLREGVPVERIEVTGNTVIDALLEEVSRQGHTTRADGSIEADLVALLGAQASSAPMVLITGHRRENLGAGFESICEAIKMLAQEFADHLFVYPVHLNPNVRHHVQRKLGGLCNVKLIPPQDYRLFVALLRRCKLVLTDSGGIQEEAPALGKPVLVMRSTTERPEGIAAGTAILTGSSTEAIVGQATRLLVDEAAYEQMAHAVNPYGDGKAASRIVRRIRSELERQT